MLTYRPACRRTLTAASGYPLSEGNTGERHTSSPAGPARVPIVTTFVLKECSEFFSRPHPSRFSYVFIEHPAGAFYGAGHNSL
ncbi:hypothetical protein J6590_097949 [Homalodisca vitripennis]|nr:hypothetical protein J6590_009800 [Homalodisca vitripennis]KAG8334070.1 hypothetical protein J6590_097949 [Homalodisca vitripennis]